MADPQSRRALAAAWRWPAALLLTGCLGVASAQSLVGPTPTEWSALSPAQRTALAPLARDWASISPAQQQKWIEIAHRHGSLPPDEQARLSQRMTEWARLSPQDRARARVNFQEARQLSPEERQQQWESYRALPADQKRALAERAQRPSAPAKPKGPASETSAGIKSSVVRPPAATVPARPVGPTVVQRGAGATTNLVSKPPAPPLHQQTGLPKVAATPEFVDKATLLPQRGAQGAAVTPSAAPTASPGTPKSNASR
jgi:hypothetical protein